MYWQGLIEDGVEDYSRDQMIQDYRFGLLNGLRNFSYVVAHIDLDSDARPMVEDLASRMVALADWECGDLIPA